MTVPTNTSQTYNATLREDISDIVEQTSPTETPFLAAIGKGKAENTYHEWPEITLDAAVDSNATIEGDDVTADAANNAVRLGNYTQLADKVVQVSSTNNAVTGVGDAQTLAKQIIYKGLALKRDIETQIMSNKAANAGGAGTARVSASFISFMRTNASRGATATAPTLSGTTTGYPNAAPGDGTQRALTETIFKTVIQSIWTNGGDPKYAFAPASQKVVISGFTGNATRYKEAEDKKLIAAIDVYVSDFGQLQIVPSRHMRTRDVIIVDPSKVEIAYLQPMKQVELAKTGHSDKRMISCEYTLVVHNDKAHGHCADLS